MQIQVLEWFLIFLLENVSRLRSSLFEVLKLVQLKPRSTLGIYILISTD